MRSAHRTGSTHTRRRTLVLLVITMITGCANMLSFSRDKRFEPDRIASYELPGNWTPRDPTRESHYALHEFRKTQSWWLKAGDPLEVHAWVIITAPDADSGTLELAVDDAMKRVLVNSSAFPSFGSMKEGDRETWVQEGSYQISGQHKPEQVIFVRSIDPVRKVGFVARVYTRKIKHEALLKITRKFFASFAFGERRAAFFDEVRDWPTVRAERVRAERARIDAMLAAQGLPPARLDATVVHDGWVYSLGETSFTIGRLLGSRAMKTYGYGARIELAWLWFRGAQWDATKPSNGAKPKRGQPFHASTWPILRWGDEIQPPLDRSLAWFFHVRRCRLTGDRWEDARDADPCDLTDWFDYARGIEREFKAGALFVE